MNDITKEVPAELREAFEKDVTAIMQRLFQTNCELIDAGFDPRPLCMALALSGVDVMALIAANMPEPETKVTLSRMIESIAADMKVRAFSALPHYIEQVKIQRAAALSAAASVVQP